MPFSAFSSKNYGAKIRVLFKNNNRIKSYISCNKVPTKKYTSLSLASVFALQIFIRSCVIFKLVTFYYYFLKNALR